MRVLVVNAGSSSLKLTLLDGDDTVIAARELMLLARRWTRISSGPRWTRCCAKRTLLGIASSTEARASRGL